MRASHLKCHGEGLSGSVHRRMGDFRAGRIESMQSLDQHAGASIRRRLGPRRHRHLGRSNQAVVATTWIGNAQRQAIGRTLLATTPGHTGLIEIKLRAAIGLKCQASAFKCIVAIGAITFGIGAPESTRIYRRDCLLQQRLVSFIQRMRHKHFLPKSFGNSFATDVTGFKPMANNLLRSRSPQQYAGKHLPN